MSQNTKVNTIVVIPTYNEANNLPELAHQLWSLAVDDLSILVVDDIEHLDPRNRRRFLEVIAEKIRTNTLDLFVGGSTEDPSITLPAMTEVNLKAKPPSEFPHKVDPEPEAEARDQDDLFVRAEQAQQELKELRGGAQ